MRNYCLLRNATVYKNVAMLAAIGGAFVLGCDSQNPAAETQQIIQNLIEAGYHDDDFLIVDGRVYVQRDAHVTLQASREMLEVNGSAEQYRTTNLVSGQTKICINPTALFNSYSQLSIGLDLAIANYNALPLVFDFARGPTTGCSANITAATTSGTGGSAGFPSGGNPYGQINIGTGLQNYSSDVTEHVITHELGHTIGFRHSDYYNRTISCGAGGNEGDSGVGAILIPGTPSTATVGGSIMNACFRSNETGEFTSSDITALSYLYPAVSSSVVRNPISTAQLDWPYIWIGDFNADGKSDIVTYDAGSFWTYLSRGDGTYGVVRNPINTAQLDWPYIWIGDFNADGKSDIVTYDAGSFWTYLSRGDGTYGVVRNPINTAQLDWPYIWIGDFNADGKSDIVTYDAGSFWTYLSRGDGTYGVVSNPINTAQLDWPYIWIGDFNADGKSDIVTYDAGSFWTYLSRGDGTYGVVRNPINTAQLDWPYIWIGDFNADGKSDIVTYDAGSFWTYLSRGDGTYGVVSNPINTAQLDWPYIWIGDFNADGKSDIVTYDAGSFWTYLSRGDGTYGVVSNPINTAQLDWPYIWIGNFNADGRSDIVTYDAGSFWTYLSR